MELPRYPSVARQFGGVRERMVGPIFALRLPSKARARLFDEPWERK